jgi:hypothetical protein
MRAEAKMEGFEDLKAISSMSSAQVWHDRHDRIGIQMHQNIHQQE